MFLLFTSFLAGALTVLAPCVLPLLPVIIGGSFSGDPKDKRRPLIITASLAVSLIVFTLLLKATTVFINISPSLISQISGGIVIAVGLLMLFPDVYAQILGHLGIEHRAQTLLTKGFSSKRSVVGPIIIGAALGPVFSSCSPVYAYILASVLPAHFAQAFAYMIAYVLGLSLVLLAIGYYGREFLARIKFAANPKGWFQRTIAVIFIIVGLLVATGYSTKAQTYISAHTPFNFDNLNTKLLPKTHHATTDSALFNVQAYQAPELTGISQWINSPPLTLQQLRGKVVLVDFWDYTCINCIRNNPYLEHWYETYKDKGLVVIGVHAPEFAFEQVPKNVEKAVQDQHITYPVGLDNSFETWSAFQNQSWPASYLIDPSGKVRRIHEGEGEYKESEQAIRQLLQANGAILGPAQLKEGTVPISNQQTPETYLGTDRADSYAGNPALGFGTTDNFTAPRTLDQDTWALSGKWRIDEQQITAAGNSKLFIKVSAKDVYMVGGSDGPAQAVIRVNGKPIEQTSWQGADVTDGKLQMNGDRLYRVVSFPAFTSDVTLEVDVPNGVFFSTFTFGS